MGVTWTDDMLTKLRELRGKNISLFECAEIIGVAYGTCLLKARELGIADRRNSGRRPGTKPNPE